MTVPVAPLVQRLLVARATVATAESLTAGLVAATLAEVPGVSAVLRGGVVAYSDEVKRTLLGVDCDLLAERGAVDGEVARQMADGVRAQLGTTFGLSTTGVAGPGPSEGKPAGTVFVAVSGPQTGRVRALQLEGDRGAVRIQSVQAVLDLLGEVLDALAALDVADESPSRPLS